VPGIEQNPSQTVIEIDKFTTIGSYDTQNHTVIVRGAVDGVTEGKSSHSVILASGWSVQEMAEYRSTMVLFTMRTQLKKFVDNLSKHYPSHTAVGMVFSAGYAEKEKVVRATLGSILDTVGTNKLPFEYLVYVGDFMN
jgi:precorrin-4 methylase